MAQDLCQAHYQILSIIFLKEFIKLNVNTDTVVQNVKLVESNIKIATAFLNTNLKDNLIEYKCLLCNKNCHQNFDEYFKKRFFNTCRFLPMISLSLFYCCQKVHLYEYMIG